MTEIEKKALALLNEFSDYEVPDLDEAQYSTTIQALCCAIEQHDAFRQEVSDVVEDYIRQDVHAPRSRLSCFIITKPVDPLVEAWNYMLRESKPGEDRLDVFREALAKRGLQVTEIER